MSINLNTLTIKNNVIFTIVMSRENLAKKCLECILGKKIREISYIETEKTNEISVDVRGVRLDVYCENEDALYNIEMQAFPMNDLPKRSRYYQDMMDMILLKKGESYDVLKKNIVIFICTFDPFEQGRHIYTFENRCTEDTSIRLEDESTKIFLNTKGTLDDIPKPLHMFLEYIETGNALDEYTKELDQAVAEVRTDEKWRKPIMTMEMYIKDRETIAKSEGIEEGIKEGVKQGIKDEQRATAFRMIAAGMPEESIRIATALTEEEFRLINADYHSK
ncbi:MAG: Rpn family recombination-promoting nuclease/putative transposase [Eubacterium sp.]|nr:Rpn family recombination-promoting nuclease/putative transposase [Eubacterium sp.]